MRHGRGRRGGAAKSIHFETKRPGPAASPSPWAVSRWCSNPSRCDTKSILAGTIVLIALVWRNLLKLLWREPRRPPPGIRLVDA
jgi:hypothetical protein